MSFDDELDKMMEDQVGIMGSPIVLFKPSMTPSADSSSMTRNKTYDDIGLNGSAHPVQRVPVSSNGKNAIVSVHTYDIRAADCTIGTPDETWLLGIGSDATEATAMPIVSVEPDAQGKGLVIQARKGG